MIRNVGVIGLGYVGLPLALAAAEAGHKVLGLDSNKQKVDRLNKGVSLVEDISNETIKDALSSKFLSFTSDYNDIKQVDVVLVCVPTPLSRDKKPDLSFLTSATKSMSKCLNRDALVILESTVAPGTSKNLFVKILQSERFDAGKNLKIAFSPERIDPSNKVWNLKNTPKIVAGLTEISREAAVEFYSTFIDNVIRCESIEVAETAKLLENSFRFVNISFINELAMLCNKIKVDINHVIKAASTKPYGYMPFYPSVGVGGHCIPVDPLYLASTASDIGVPILSIEAASTINSRMPEYFVERVANKLGRIVGKKILVVGISYKPNVADVRETPVEPLILGLRAKGALVFWHDDLVSEWRNEKSSKLTDLYDLAILATPHDYIDLSKLGEIPILDTRGSL